MGATHVLKEEALRQPEMKELFKVCESGDKLKRSGCVVLFISNYIYFFFLKMCSKPKLALNGVGGKSATELLRHLQWASLKTFSEEMLLRGREKPIIFKFFAIYSLLFQSWRFYGDIWRHVQTASHSSCGKKGGNVHILGKCTCLLKIMERIHENFPSCFFFLKFCVYTWISYVNKCKHIWKEKLNRCFKFKYLCF